MSEQSLAKCGARLPNTRGGDDFICELAPHNKYKKHRIGGVTWTDGGAERIRQEIATDVAAKQAGT
jgi:hypothetical protein